MKHTKHTIQWFPFYDRTGIEAHLTRMAQRGWLPEKIGWFLWRWRRTAPERRAFSVCYFSEASMYDPAPSEGQETFYDFCAHTGWKLAASGVQMQVFYNQREEPVPIHTDPASELDSIHRTAKRSFLPIRVILLLAALFLAWQTPLAVRDNPVSAANPFTLFFLICAPVLILLAGTDLAGYFLWRHRARRAAEQGEFLETKSHPALRKVLVGLMLAAVVWLIVYTTATGTWSDLSLLGMLVLTGGYVLVLGITTLVRKILQWKKVSADTNRLVSAWVSRALAFLLLALFPVILWGLDQRDRPDLPAGSPDLVLTMTELLDLPDSTPDWHREASRLQSPLLGHLSVDQSLGGGDRRLLRYSVWSIRAPFLYDLCETYLLTQYDTRDNERIPEGEKQWYEPADPAPWGAETVYEKHYQNPAAGSGYLLCGEGRIIEVNFSWKPTPEQIALAAQRLAQAYTPVS